MADAEHLRSQATWFLAAAMKAHERGDHALMGILTRRAIKYIDDVDARGAVTQQQQQPQPKSDGE